MNNKIIEMIESIYDSEIPCRIEWMFDGGFVWSIQNNSYPRIFIDNDLSGSTQIIAENTDNVLLRNDIILKKDWIERGYNYSLNDAIKELAKAVCKHFPNSEFAKWYNPE